MERVKRKPRRKGIVVHAAESEFLARWIELVDSNGKVCDMPIEWLIRAGMPADHVPKKLRIIVEEVKE